MKIQLSTAMMPNATKMANTVALAKELSRVTNLGASKAIYTAKELFADLHDETNPIELELLSEMNVSELERICSVAGIDVRVVLD